MPSSIELHETMKMKLKRTNHCLENEHMNMSSLRLLHLRTVSTAKESNPLSRLGSEDAAPSSDRAALARARLIAAHKIGK
jgi:hypothetical protein